MKLTWHLIAKDFRRLRWALAAWLALFVLQVAVGFMLLRGNGADLDKPVVLQLTGALLVFVQLLSGYLLVGRMVHEDPVVGTQAIWLTQPIAAWRLLVAKLLGAGLMFGLLPVLVMVPWWLSCGFGWPEFWRAALVALAWQAGMVILGMWLASIADTVGRFLLWTLVLVAAVITAELTFVLTGAQPSQPDASVELVVTRQWVALGFLLATGLTVTVHQYLSRRRRWSVVYSVLGLGLAVLAMIHWPWTVRTLGPALSTRPAVVAPFATDEIRVSLAKATLATVDAKLSRRGVWLSYNLDSVPADAGVLGLQVRHTWTWPDGFALERIGLFSIDWRSGGFPARLGPALGLPEPPKDPETEAWMELLRERSPGANARRDLDRARLEQGDNPILPVASRRNLHTFLWLPESVAQRIRRERPTYDAKVDIVLTRASGVVSFPLADRHAHAFEAQTIRITDTLQEDRAQLNARIVATVPSWNVDSRQSLNRLIGTMRIDPNNGPNALTAIDLPFLVNRRTGEYKMFNGRGLAVAQVCGVMVSWGSFQALAPKVRRSDKWVVRDADWFGESELWVVRAQGATRFSRNVAAAHFELVAPRPVKGGDATD